MTFASPARRHQHHHDQFEKRQPEAAVNMDVPGAPVVNYELNGKLLDKVSVCQGIENGTLQWIDGDWHELDCFGINKPTPAPVQVPSALTPTSNAEAVTLLSRSLPNPNPITAAPSDPSPELIARGKAVDKVFPDGEIDCSDFPSKYGPIKVEWSGLDGWSSIQHVTIEGDVVSYIETAQPGGSCEPGSMCSYACPAGYQKSQWPAQQGAAGESVGGLRCNENGKLTLTNPDLSNKLCIKGTGETKVQNKLSNNAAICRTDYPGTSSLKMRGITNLPHTDHFLGTEAEVIPLDTKPDSTVPLTCPDANKYYKHNGDPTSAQYYINNQGVAVEDACIWGEEGSGKGNWAPSYLGVGKDLYGKTWLSISSTAQNNPSHYEPLNFTVEITGDTSGKCRLTNGQYCSGDDYSNCNPVGCTVSSSPPLEQDLAQS